MAGIHQPIKIQWNFTNHCNFNCEYCPDVLKSGSVSLPDPQVFARAFDTVYNKFTNFELSLLGGEPTAYRGLDWALKNIVRNNDKKIILETNGSRDLNWWRQYGNLFDTVRISYHHNLLAQTHFLAVLETLRDLGTSVHIKLPITPKYWDDTIHLKTLLNLNGYNPEIQLLYKNFTRGNNDYYQYGEDQLNFYYKDKNVDDSQIPNQIEYKKINRLNTYTGHMCWAGVEQLVIDKFGYVWRGWCELGGALGNLYTGQVNWPEDPILCTRDLCTNGFDLQVRKSENSWGRI